MNYTSRTIFVCLSILSLSSCYYDIQEELHPESATQNCDTSISHYSTQIKAIMQNSCNSCHSTGSASAGIVTDNYQELKRIADNGTLVGSVNHKSGYIAMPRNMPKLSNCSLLLIDKWIREGTQNN